MNVEIAITAQSIKARRSKTCLKISTLMVLYASSAFSLASIAYAGEIPSTVVCSGKSLGSTAFSADGRLFASIEGNDKTQILKLYDASTGKLLRTVCSAKYISYPSFTPDGRLLACVEENGTSQSLKLYDAASSKYLRTLCSAKLVFPLFSTDGRLLACTEGNGSSQILKLYEVASGKFLRTIGQEETSIYATFSPGGRLLSKDQDSTIARAKLYETGSGKFLGTVCSAKEIYPAFSRDGRLLACTENNATSASLNLYDGTSGKSPRTICSAKSMTAPFFSPDGRLLACVENNGSSDSLKLYETTSGTLARTVCSAKSLIFDSFSPDGRLLACHEARDFRANDGARESLKLYETASGTLLRTVSSASYVYFHSFSPDGRLLACGEDNGTSVSLNLYKLDKDGLLSKMISSSPQPLSAKLSSNAQIAAAVAPQSGALPGSVAINGPRPVIKSEVIPVPPTGGSNSMPAVKPAGGAAVNGTAPGAKPTGAIADTPKSSGPGSKDKPLQDKWALVVGISNFKHDIDPSRKSEAPYRLRYAAKDALDFYNYLINDCHFKKDHVLLLLNEKATRSNIMAGFGNNFLPAVTKPGDLDVVYISTHGTPAAKDAGKCNYIVAYDTYAEALYESGVNMDELLPRMKKSVDTDRILIVMDTCYSGAGVPGARGTEDGANFDLAKIAQGTGHLFLSSSSSSERSWESRISQNGVFTKYLINSLRLTKGNVKNAFEKLKDDVGWEVKSAYNQSQHPVLGGQWEGKELNLAAPATNPRQNLNPDLLKLMNAQPVQQKKATP